MARFVAKEVYGSGKGGPYYVHDADGQYEDSPKQFRLKRTAERYAARMQKKASLRKSNPRKKTGQLLFKSRAAAVKYARAQGAKRYSVKKLARGR
jgi:hypothetical protein